MLQIVGFLAGCMIAVFVVYFGSIALATRIVIFALRFGPRTAKNVRAIFIVVYVLKPPVIAFLCLDAAGLTTSMSIIFSTMILIGTGCFGVILADETRKVLKDNVHQH